MLKKILTAFVTSVILLIAVIFLTSSSSGLTHEIFSNIAAGIILVWLFGVPLALLGFLLYAFFTRNRAPQVLPINSDNKVRIDNSGNYIEDSTIQHPPTLPPQNLNISEHLTQNPPSVVGSKIIPGISKIGRFIAIDFETATSTKTSACSLGIVLLKAMEQFHLPIHS